MYVQPGAFTMVPSNTYVPHPTKYARGTGGAGGLSGAGTSTRVVNSVARGNQVGGGSVGVGGRSRGVRSGGRGRGNSFAETQKMYVKQGWPPHAFDHPVEVIPGVWLSGVGFTEDLPTWCDQNEFTHILNASGSYGREYHYRTDPEVYNLEYLELEMDDLPNFRLGPFLEPANNFIQDSKLNRGKILIHCIWGQSRSVSCLLYFIMTRWYFNYDMALGLIRRVRPKAHPNEGFEAELKSIWSARTHPRF